MFAALKSLLSSHVAPGGVHVHYAPFSFAWFTRPSIRANAGDDAIERAELTVELIEVDRLLDNDDLIGGRERVKAILRRLIVE